jgi:hypothetical protein
MPIPKKLHYIWIAKRDFNEGEFTSIKSAIENTSFDVYLHTNLKRNSVGSKFNPYKIKHSRFHIVPTEFPEEIEGVKLRPANISDIFRIIIIHNSGGFYSDLDIILFKDFEPSVFNHSLVVNGIGTGVYHVPDNAFIGAEKGHPALKALSEELEEKLAKRAERGKTDMTEKDSDYFYTYYIMRDFLKKKADYIFPSIMLQPVPFRTLGRAVLRSGKELRNLLVMKKSELTSIKGRDTVKFTDEAYGFNWFAGAFKWETIKGLPAVKDKLEELNLL